MVIVAWKTVDGIAMIGLCKKGHGCRRCSGGWGEGWSVYHETNESLRYLYGRYVAHEDFKPIVENVISYLDNLSE